MGSDETESFQNLNLRSLVTSLLQAVHLTAVKLMTVLQGVHDEHVASACIERVACEKARLVPKETLFRYARCIFPAKGRPLWSHA